MLDFVLPDTVANQLEGCPYPVPLSNTSGRMLGYFVPTADSSLYTADKEELSDADLQKIEESHEWYSTAEVLQHLEKIE
jgi:hypothetical protein